VAARTFYSLLTRSYLPRSGTCWPAGRGGDVASTLARGGAPQVVRLRRRRRELTFLKLFVLAQLVSSW